MSHAHRDTDRKDNSPGNGLRRKFDVWGTCNTFGSSGSIKVAGRGKWSEQCPSRDIFYTLALHCSRCSLFRIHTFRNRRLQIGEILLRPVIRIHSDHKWPERIVYDTSLQTIVPAQIASTEAKVAAPEIVASTAAREAFAQLPPSSQLSDARKIGAEAATSPENCKATRRPACTSGSAANAIWLVWQQHLVKAKNIQRQRDGVAAAAFTAPEDPA